MRIGIISDTHDNIKKIDRAVDFFNKKKVDFVFHAGDFVAPFSALRFKNLKCPWQAVFGNNDGERKGLISISEGKIKEPPVRVTLENIKIILVHDISILDIEKEEAEVIIFGHTHKRETFRKANKFFINPGEAGGWLTGSSSLCILEIPSLKPTYFKI